MYWKFFKYMRGSIYGSDPMLSEVYKEVYKRNFLAPLLRRGVQAYIADPPPTCRDFF